MTACSKVGIELLCSCVRFRARRLRGYQRPCVLLIAAPTRLLSLQLVCDVKGYLIQSRYAYRKPLFAESTNVCLTLARPDTARHRRHVYRLSVSSIRLP